MTKLGFIVFTMGVMFFLSAMMIDTFDNLLLYFDHLIKALTDKEYGTRNITKTFAGLCSGRRLPPRRTLRLLGYFNFRRI